MRDGHNVILRHTRGYIVGCMYLYAVAVFRYSSTVLVICCFMRLAGKRFIMKREGRIKRQLSREFWTTGTVAVGGSWCRFFVFCFLFLFCGDSGLIAVLEYRYRYRTGKYWTVRWYCIPRA